MRSTGWLRSIAAGETIVAVIPLAGLMTRRCSVGSPLMMSARVRQAKRGIIEYIIAGLP
jgi:hypothetical protein